MNKIYLGVCFVLVVLCGFLYWNLHKANEQITLYKVELAQAEQTIGLKNTQLRVNDEVMSNLLKEKEALLVERATAKDTIEELLKTVENHKWGKESVPADIRNFLQELQQPLTVKGAEGEDQ